jgi:hypothetical protein
MVDEYNLYKMLNLTLSPISRTRVYPFAPLVNFMTNLKENKKTISISGEFAGEVITSTQFFFSFFVAFKKRLQRSYLGLYR